MTLKKHKNYDIINNKLFLTKKINLDKILLMEDIIFKHLDKNSYSFKPENIIKPESVIKINNFGFKNNIYLKDLYIKFNIIFPICHVLIIT